MDLEDATDTSTDSQIVLAIEFNNQATLHQEEGVDTGKLLDNAVANNWYVFYFKLFTEEVSFKS